MRKLFLALLAVLVCAVTPASAGVVPSFGAGAARALGFGISSSGTPSDPYWSYVSLLDSGNGSNGAQNNTFLDSSSNNFSITRINNTTQGSATPYRTLWSNYFDGSGSYLSLPANAAFNNGTGNFTIEFWWNPRVLPTGSTIVPFIYHTDNVGVSGAGQFVFIFNSTLGPRLYVNGGTFDISQGSVTGWQVGQWYHIALVRNGTTVTIYRNGVSIASGTSAIQVGTSTVSTILGGDTFDSFYLNGELSNVRIVNGTAVYTGAFTPPTAPLTAVSGTSLLTAQSNRMIDNSSNAFAITVAGDTRVLAMSPFSLGSAYSYGTNGGSGYFDTADDLLSLASNAALTPGSGDFTWEAWINPAAWPTTSNLWTTEGTGGMVIGKNGTNFVLRSYGTADLLTFATMPPLNQWTHVAITRSGTTGRMFYNGVQVATGTVSNNFAQAAVYVGNEAAETSDFNGYMSDVRFVKGTALYTAPFTPPTAPLTAVSGTQLLLGFTNGAVYDSAFTRDQETVADAQISTTQFKFGSSSISFDGVGDGLLFAGSPGLTLGLSDFTIETWMYLNSTSGTQGIFDCRPVGVQGIYPDLYITGGAVVFNTGSADRITGSALSTGQWYHVALTRSSGSTRLFVNGVQQGTTYTDTNSYLCAAVAAAGTESFSTSFPLNGYLQDLRITNGIARYTSTFTPPVAPFPNK